MFVLKKQNDPKMSEVNFHARLCHLKELLKNIQPVMSASFLFTEEKNLQLPHQKTRRMTNCMYIDQPRRKTW